MPAILNSSAKMQDDSLRIAVAIGLGLIGLASVPAAQYIVVQLTTREPKSDTYEDEDGKATPESVKAYSAKWAKISSVIFALISSGTAIASAVLTTLHVGNEGLLLEDWLSAGASVSLRAALNNGIDV